MYRNKSVDVHQFAMVPRADIPRSGFKIESGYKTTFDAGYLVPVYVEEVLPGDSFNLKATLFARMTTPILPIMDNLWLETFFFFVPNRLCWTNWKHFMGEKTSPTDTNTYVVPTVTTPTGGYAVNSLFDYMGLPTVGQVGAGNTVTHNSLPLRAYNLIWNEWFRDENLQTKVNQGGGDGPDDPTNFVLLRRGKRKDYFTSALPWPQKGPGVSIPLGTTAAVKTQASQTFTGAQAAIQFNVASSGNAPSTGAPLSITAARELGVSSTGTATPGTQLYPANLYADLSNATAATINSLRQAFQIQRLYERDARGGSRYTELVRSHFGVVSPDARLQRPEYLGGGSQRVNISPVTQTSASNAQPTPQGNLAAIGTSAGSHGFTRSFTEHGTIIGLIEARCDLNYQQGLNRMWTRRTRFDFYWPVLANLGEQAILNQEIYAQGAALGATDIAAFGYQERWAEYRYYPSLITGQFRSTAATPLDVWHLAQKFTALPTLGATFIQDTPPINRILAVPSQPEFLMDSFIDVRATRPMPVYSVPGMIDHF